MSPKSERVFPLSLVGPSTVNDLRCTKRTLEVALGFAGLPWLPPRRGRVLGPIRAREP